MIRPSFMSCQASGGLKTAANLTKDLRFAQALDSSPATRDTDTARRPHMEKQNRQNGGPLVSINERILPRYFFDSSFSMSLYSMAFLTAHSL